MKTQMISFKKHSIVIVSLLIVLLAFTWNFNKVSAASGGVAGGSFFDSDSSSSSSDSFKSDSDSEYEYAKQYDHHHMHDSSYSRYANERHHMYNSHSHDADNYNDNDEHPTAANGPILFFMVFTFGLFAIGFYNKGINDNSVTVLNFQVSLVGDPRCTIQRDLTRIAEAADTSSKEGVSNLLTEAIQALDQHLSYCCAGYSSVDIKRNKEDGQKCYNQQSIDEREKFDEETLVNLNNNNKTRIRSQSDDSFGNEETKFEKTLNLQKEKLLTGIDNKYIVIILLVAAKGVHKLPTINGGEDLMEAFQKLKSLVSNSNKLLAGELLWTPQKEDDIPLVDRKLFKDYPELSKCMFDSVVERLDFEKMGLN